MQPGRYLSALSAAVAALLWAGADARAGELGTAAGRVAITPVLTGLDEPWSLAFLPGGGFLVTERGGRLLHVAEGRVRPVAGLPEVEVDGQGGLFDVLVPRDFAATREVFLSYAAPQGRGSGTTLARARLSPDGARLEGLRVIFALAPGSRGGRHFGGRIVEGPEGHLFLTIGDRGDDDSAQDRANQNGTLIRLNRDGSVPADNPFAGQPGMRAEIWSFGHRNPQGAALDAEGRLWTHEHGARGGDEINLIRPGANYGWPVIAYGRHYSGLPIGEGTARPGMEQPALYWDPSIAPSGMAIYTGRLRPEWAGDMFVGSLKFDTIVRLERDGAGWREAERIAAPETGRVRDILEAPDGSLWFLSVHEGAVFRMAPAE